VRSEGSEVGATALGMGGRPSLLGSSVVAEAHASTNQGLGEPQSGQETPREPDTRVLVAAARTETVTRRAGSIIPTQPSVPQVAVGFI